MRGISCFILLAPLLTAIFAQDWVDNGADGFNLDWFWLGSNLRSLGRPKFKISEHPDGYSAQFGVQGTYMRIRYTESDRSVDFNVLDHKGSIKYKASGIRSPDGHGFTAEFDLSGPTDYRRSPIDGKLKLLFRPREGPNDSITVDLSLSNSARIRTYIFLPSTRIREVENIESLLRIVINPENPTKSTADFYVNIKAAQMYKDGDEDYYSGEWLPGNYNLTGSLKMAEMNMENSRQPRCKAILDLAENKDFEGDDSVSVPRNQDTFKKSLVLDGMINLTGQGNRFGVLKVTDAATDRPIGRIQGRRADEENLRLEVFGDGEQLGALNYQKSEASEIYTIEDNAFCGPNYIDYPTNGNEFEVLGVNQTNSIDSLTNGNETDLSDNTDWKPCNKYRLSEKLFGDGNITGSIYQDVLDIGVPPHYRDNARRIHGSKWIAKDGYNEISMTFLDGYSTVGIIGIIKNVEDKTSIEIAQRVGHTGTGEKLQMEIEPGTTEDYNLKLKYNGERIFDGWSIVTKDIRRLATADMPTFMKEMIQHDNKGNKDAVEWLRNNI